MFVHHNDEKTVGYVLSCSVMLYMPWNHPIPSEYLETSCMMPSFMLIGE